MAPSFTQDRHFSSNLAVVYTVASQETANWIAAIPTPLDPR
ncbi:hypothetical protein DJ66_0606 [Candidatus Liberibacter solanacearum]|uniref:Uncharacterized protein n=1 Tax=Candidatus Liberibacter solanacearum TaxID=556287 RepID=A0A0F4VK45_9HYPH|nr:hypothetical protein DJ66_0606 [Candidatus Liberibacter solanacearum]